LDWLSDFVIENNLRRSLGVEAVTYFMCLKALNKITTPDRGFPKNFLVIYATFIFLLATVYTWFLTGNVIVAFGLHWNTTGGPMAYLIATYSSKKSLTNRLTSMLAGYCANALLVSLHGSSHRRPIYSAHQKVISLPNHI
jgi:hypothetical protein